jgi:hypothetical protein
MRKSPDRGLFCFLKSVSSANPYRNPDNRCHQPENQQIKLILSATYALPLR